jgi:hypothetical protein
MVSSLRQQGILRFMLPIFRPTGGKSVTVNGSYRSAEG